MSGCQDGSQDESQGRMPGQVTITKPDTDTNLGSQGKIKIRASDEGRTNDERRAGERGIVITGLRPPSRIPDHHPRSQTTIQNPRSQTTIQNPRSQTTIQTRIGLRFRVQVKMADEGRTTNEAAPWFEASSGMGSRSRSKARS